MQTPGSQTDSFVPPTLSQIHEAREWLSRSLPVTPVGRWNVTDDLPELHRETEVFAKLELLQHAGSFKTRGALLNLRQLDPDQRARGVTAVSAGNHAIALSWAARRFGLSAKVVMPKAADPYRIERCQALGAEVVLADDVHAAFERVREIETQEGRTFVHPFEGPAAALGTATLGAEVCEQIAELDAVVIPIGGGGLCGGAATAIKALRPKCAVYGVEPTGADSMSRSLAAGRPVILERVETIADSLGSPRAEPYSFSLCQRFVDDVVRVTDADIERAVARTFFALKLAVEPAAATALAALVGPLRERLTGRKVALITCGTNIGAQRFTQLLAAGLAAT